MKALYQQQQEHAQTKQLTATTMKYNTCTLHTVITPVQYHVCFVLRLYLRTNFLSRLLHHSRGVPSIKKWKLQKQVCCLTLKQGLLSYIRSTCCHWSGRYKLWKSHYYYYANSKTCPISAIHKGESQLNEYLWFVDAVVVVCWHTCHSSHLKTWLIVEGVGWEICQQIGRVPSGLMKNPDRK